MNNKVLGNATDRISEIDLHPNKQGQEKIAQFIFDRLGYSKGLNKIGVYI